MSKKLRVGVVGLGMGKGHINGYREHENVEVVAVADTNQERLELAKKDFEIEKCYTDANEMFDKEKLDLVSIAVPNKFHNPLTIAALESGANVLCEKPMAMNAAEGEEMIAAAKRCGKRLAINFSFRFTPQSQMMKQMVEDGELGEIYFARSIWHRRRGMPGFGGWFGTKELSGGGPLIDLGVHRLDLALWLMDYPEPEWVIGSTYNPIATAAAKKAGKTFDVEDFACAMIKFKNGATIELEASWAANIKERDLMETRLLGTSGGMFQYNLNEGYEFDVDCYYEKHGRQFDMKLHRNNVVYGPAPQAHNGYYRFADAIINDTDHIVSAEQGLTVMKLLDAIYKSAATGEPVKVN